MGLFYRALERAQNDPRQQEPGNAAPETTPAATAGRPKTWTEAAVVDMAGMPLAVEEPAAPPPPGSAAVTLAPRRVIRLREPVWEVASNHSLARRKRLQADSEIALEQGRILRTRVLDALRARGLQTLLVTSALPGEGKTVLSVSLAMQISSLREQRVLLIDADLRRTGLTRQLEPAPDCGLSDYLQGTAQLGNLIYDVDPYLAVIPSQPLADQAPELLAGERMQALLRWARQQFDCILLDGAPVGLVADSRILARLTEAALLVVREGMSAVESVEEAARLLQPYLLGSVLNGARHLRRRRYGYGYSPYLPGEGKRLKT
ncbi:MAG: CpsD/CapB family tyrosine-protein kinase [Terriglobales bacterium]